MKRIASGAGVLLVLAIGSAVATVDHWFFTALDPGPFDPKGAPPAPDYAQPEAWAARPSSEDGADVFLPEFPARDATSTRADVFYVHPTTWVGRQWNGPVADPVVTGATERGGTLIQASAFNACCAVYAPRYRQANGRAFIVPSGDGDRAVELAYSDVARAFESFQRTRGTHRPFLLASHSQGTILAARLLRERIAQTADADQLVAAYLVGGPISDGDLGGLPVCSTPSQSGCMVGWNARGPAYSRNGLEFAERPGAPRSEWICVNPLDWHPSVGPGPRETALFFDADVPRPISLFGEAACADGYLIVRDLGSAPRDAMSRILDWMMGPQNYHPIEYQLFYLEIRRNAAARVDAFERTG